MDDFELSALAAAGLETAGRPEGGGRAEPMTYREKRAAEAALSGNDGADEHSGRGRAPDGLTRSRIERLEAEVSRLRGGARSTPAARFGSAPEHAPPEARAADVAFGRQRAAADAAAWRARPAAPGPAWQPGTYPYGRGAMAGGAGPFRPVAPSAPQPQAFRPAGRRWGTLPGAMDRPGVAAAAPGWPAGAYPPAVAAGRGPGPGPLGIPPGRVWQGAPDAVPQNHAAPPRGAWRPAPGTAAGFPPGESPLPHPPMAGAGVPPQATADRAAPARDAFGAARPPSAADAHRHTERVRAYAAKQDHARTELPDYDRVVGAARIPVSHALAEALVESEHTARLEYHLARSPEKLAELNRLPPREAARAVGRLEAEIAGAATPRPTRAPAPLTPLRGGASGPMRSLAELAQSEDAAGYIELRRAQRRA